jgi:hypothetical protein
LDRWSDHLSKWARKPSPPQKHTMIQAYSHEAERVF